MSDDIARVTKVRAAGARILRIRFAGDRHDRELNLTGLIARSVHFAPLMDDAATFAKAKTVEQGLGVSWPVPTKRGPLDVSATTLRQIADEQQPMTGENFAEWRTALGLSLTEAAKLLGVGRRTIMGYLKKDELPPVVAIACRALARQACPGSPLCPGTQGHSTRRVIREDVVPHEKKSSRPSLGRRFPTNVREIAAMTVTRQSLVEHFRLLSDEDLLAQFQSGELTEMAEGGRRIGAHGAGTSIAPSLAPKTSSTKPRPRTMPRWTPAILNWWHGMRPRRRPTCCRVVSSKKACLPSWRTPSRLKIWCRLPPVACASWSRRRICRAHARLLRRSRRATSRWIAPATKKNPEIGVRGPANDTYPPDVATAARCRPRG